MRFVVASLFLGLSLVAPAALAAPSVSIKEGKVCARSNDACPDLDIGQGVGDGVLAEVPAGEKVVLSIPGGTVTALAGTTFRVAASTKLKVANRKDDTPAAVLTLVRGRILVALAEKSREALLVRGPGKLQAIVVNGDSSVRTDGESFSVKTTRGAALLGVGNDWTDVAPGTVRFLRKGEDRSEARKLREAPKLTASRTLAALVPGGGLRDPSTEVEPVLGAHGYEIALFDEGKEGEGAWRRVVTERQSTEAIATAWTGLAPGRYVVRARALDKEGTEGEWSPPVKLGVVGITLPKGAVAGGGTIELPLRARLALQGVEDVESATGQGPFSAAPGVLQLLTDSPQTVRLRKAGGADEVVLRLVPRTLRAEVVLSPKNAVWPRDAVTIRVRLSGRRPEGLEIKPSVSLGIDPIDVTFETRGDELVATVPARAVEKPTVLRVEVKDGDGAELGRGFLEIAK